VAFLTSKDIQDVDDIVRESVPVPEWKGEVLVRCATTEERDAYDESLFESRKVGKRTELKANFANAKARLVALCTIDDQGRRIFQDKDIAWLGKKAAVPVNRIYAVIARLSGMTVKAEEELEKNSESGQTESSSSA